MLNRNLEDYWFENKVITKTLQESISPVAFHDMHTNIVHLGLSYLQRTA